MKIIIHNIYTSTLAIVLIIGLIGCTNKGQDPIIVATAANAQFAVEEIVQRFKNETGIDVELKISSSGKHVAQIEAGAPCDVFISADMKYPTQLYSEGLTQGEPRVYAFGRLVIWSLYDIDIDNLKDLGSIDITNIALPNPKIAPYGRAAREALEYYKLSNKVEEFIVYGESVAQTNQFILTKAADIGFTATSVVMAPRMKGVGIWHIVDNKAYSPIKQGAVVLKNSSDIDSAIKFYNYLFSPVSQEILAKYGYEIVDSIE